MPCADDGNLNLGLQSARLLVIDRKSGVFGRLSEEFVLLLIFQANVFYSRHITVVWISFYER